MLTIRIENRPGGLWLWLCRFAYRRLKAMPMKDIPVGIPGMRDPYAPCTAYAPRPHEAGEFGDCMTDGHYQCDDCAHVKRCPDCGNRVNSCECEG